MKRFLLFAILLTLSASAFAQLKYAVTGIYNKNAAQGMAIWGDNAYLFSNTGYCRVFNLKTASVTAEFALESTDESNHSNSASFGVETPQGSTIPAIYVSECYGQNRCFVEKILSDRSELIQTISAVENGEVMKFFDWVVDRENGYIYGIRTKPEAIDEAGTKEHEIVKFRLPKLSDGKEVIFEEKDVVDRFTVYFANLTQGACIRGRYLYMPTGLQQAESQRLDSNRSIKVIDLKNKVLKKSVDLSLVTVNEPEDMDFYGNKALLYCGQMGGLYQVKL